MEPNEGNFFLVCPKTAMFDVFLRSLSPNDVTTLEETLALLHNELFALPASLRWKDLRQIAQRRPKKVLAILTELLADGTLSGLALYIDAKPVGVCLWGVSNEEGVVAEKPSLVCLFVAADYEGRGLDRWMLSAAEEALAKEAFRKVS